LSPLSLAQRQLQAIYAIEAPPVADFLVDREEAQQIAPGARVGREAVLVHEVAGEAGIAVFVDPSIVERVAAHPPGEAANADLDAFAVVTEAVSHFLLLVHRARRDEGVSLLELETQAEVDKFVTARLLSRSAAGLRDRLFRDAALDPALDEEERQRYTTAGRLADRYCAQLERLPHVDALLVELRGFWRLSGHARMGRLRRAA